MTPGSKSLGFINVRINDKRHMLGNPYNKKGLSTAAARKGPNQNFFGNLN